MDFYKRISLVCDLIPNGTVVSYGQIALLCGKPHNARQVGYALKHGLAGRHVPAHRVINSQGILSGADAFETSFTQKKLLEKEGIKVSRIPEGWQVDLKKYGWHHTLEDAFWLKAEFERRDI